MRHLTWVRTRGWKLRFVGDEKLEYWGLLLSKRIFKVLMANNIGSIKELLTYSQEELLKLRFVGRLTTAEIEDKLQELGLHLK